MIGWWFALPLGLAQDVVTDGLVPDLNAQRFRPTLDGARTLVVDDSARPHQGASVRALLGYHDDLLVYAVEGQDPTRIVGNVVQADLLATYGYEFARIGLGLPVFLFADGDATAGEAGLGDVAVDGRFALLGREAPLRFPIDLGVQGRITLPTSTVRTSLGDPAVTWRVALVGSVELGPVLLAANVGTAGLPGQALENGTLDDAFEFRAGGALDLTDTLGVSLETSGLVHYGEPLGNRVGQAIEGLVGAYWKPHHTIDVRGGVGRGLSAGFGSPDLRIVVGLGVRPRTKSRAESPRDAERRVAVTADRIDLAETINFEWASDRLVPASEALLDEVATLMRTHPEIARVRIEGHTDPRGDDAFNLDLSKRRAKAVMRYLIARGVASERLVSEGYGETRPLDPAHTPAAWEKNRRVELFVEAWDRTEP